MSSASRPVAQASPAAVASPVAKPTGSLTSVRAGSLFGLLDTPWILAAARGYFQQAGLTLDVQRFDTIATMIPLLSTGQLDVAFDGATSAGFFNAFARGINLRMVANQGVARGTSDQRPYYAIVGSKALIDAGKLQRIADLKGQPVNILAEGVLAQLLVDAALKSDGLTLKDVQQQQMGFPDALPALKNGAIAASFLVEPFITLGRQQGLLDVLVSGEKLAPDREITDVFYSSAFAQKRDAANGFMVAYLQGVRDYMRTFQSSGADRTAAAIQLIPQLAVKEAAAYNVMGFPVINPDGRINAADVKAQQDWYVSAGLVQQPIDVTQAIDNSFVDAALATLGPFKG
ncbi:MAG: ABC transporter substrate-binding protein [Chloroflexi bacterium]|nr:ABC transporter substrate-binding protein [Chloroflexota bacterium]